MNDFEVLAYLVVLPSTEAPTDQAGSAGAG
jgi:hypothetical protein